MSETAPLSPVTQTVAGVLDHLRFSRFHIKIIVALSLVGFIEAYATAVTGALVVSARGPLHMSGTETKWLVIAPTITLVISMFVGSVYLSDRFSRRRILLVGVVWSTLFTLLTPLAPTATVLIVFRLLSGFGYGLALPAAYPLGTELLPPRRRSTFGWTYEIMLGIGFTLTTVMGYVISHAHLQDGWRLLPLPGGALLFVAPLLIVRFVPESPRWLAERGQAAKAEKVLRAICAKTDSPPPPPLTRLDGTPAPHQPVPPFLTLFTRRMVPHTLLAVGVWVFSLVPFYIVSTLLPEVLVHEGYAVATSFGLAIIIFAVTLPGKWFNGLLMERIGRRATLAGSLLLSAVAVVILLVFQGVVALIVAEIILGLTVFSAFPTVRIYMIEQFPTPLRGRGYFFAELVGRFLAGIPIPFILAGSVSRPNVIFTVILVSVLIGGLIPVFFGKDTRGALESAAPTAEPDGATSTGSARRQPMSGALSMTKED